MIKELPECFKENSTLLALVAIAVIGYIAIYFCKALKKSEIELSEKFNELGFDQDDVEVFIDNSSFSLDEFFKSPSLRKQYCNWRDGKTSLHAEHHDNSQLATGLAIGIVASNIGRE